MLKHRSWQALSIFAYAALFAGATTPAVADSAGTQIGVREVGSLGESVEKHLPTDEPWTKWVQDPQIYEAERGDRIETTQVLAKEAKTVKLHNVVPPIHFESGQIEIPPSYVEMLRDVLGQMRHRANVRVHFVGHADNVPLTGRAAQQYGDNLGLSRERAGTVAEHFQRALGLPPESVSYEGLGESAPVASNDTAAGRAQNRRVEVEVWYDEIEEKLVEREVLVSQDLNRVKVCRVETVCKLRYKEGHARRARVKNLIPALHYDEGSTGVPPEFVQQVRQALRNLGDKQNVVVKFIAYTDDSRLTERNERIYGDQVGLSKAIARRVALGVQDALGLPSAGIETDGKGAAMPVAANDTERGRALNRRVEVEFWHDDPLQELPDEPQLCPEDAGAEIVTRVYEPSDGPIPAVIFENGKPVVPNGYVARLERLLNGVDKTNVRLRFLGYTHNDRLDRRTAMVYGDDIGLSTARARRTMETMVAELGSAAGKAEFEGRGYVQSDDVVNSGFVKSDVSRVEVQIVYDDLALLDDADGMDITRMTREVSTQNPYALNLMRITVDGKPVDDPNKSIPDIQRCTDVALHSADIQFTYDNLEIKPRLNVTAWPITVQGQPEDEQELGGIVHFKTYSNYPNHIVRSEVRIFDKEQSVRDVPLAVVEVGDDGYAEWQPDLEGYKAPGRELKYVLRVYDRQDRFDETSPQRLWVVDALQEDLDAYDREKELLVGYGETRLATQNITLRGGAVKVFGQGIPADHSVWVAGRPVPVADDGKFVVEQIFPSGLHTVEVAVLDQAGNGELFLRDLELKKSDWFYVGIADLTVSANDTRGPAELVTNDPAYGKSTGVDGRLAFFVNGKFGQGWQLTASADTREAPVEDIFSNLMDKTPDALFRRIDPDYHYPAFGDDSMVEELAPTLGKFYVKLKQDENYGLWGNFKVAYTDTDLAHVDRGLYGANVHYQGKDTTSFGEQRFMIDGFAADPGTVASREEFRGTGGSLYFLRRQDLLVGSERVRIEVRDKDSGIVTGVRNLTPALDYDIDYLQGRIMLSEPLSATADDRLLVRTGGLSGNDVYLVVRYEFTPGFDGIDTLAVGGRTHYWVGDQLKLGVTTNKTTEGDDDSTLNAADLTLRKTADSWVKLEVSRSEGAGLGSLQSPDGGFTFDPTAPPLPTDASAGAYRVDTSVNLQDFFESGKGRLTFYTQKLEAGYSAPGLLTPTDVDQYGGSVRLPITERAELRAKADKRVQDQGLETSAEEVNLGYQLNENWTVSSGVRNDSRTDNSPVVPLTQEQGKRSDVVLQAEYDSLGRWSTYGFVQDSIRTTGNMPENGRVGAGGAYRVTDRFRVQGEASDGDLGTAGRIGTDFLYSDRTNLYLNYALENERTDNGIRARKGTATSGFRTRYSDSASVYLEERYTHGEVPTGLTHSTGVDLAPTDHLSLGAKLDFGTLRDRQTAAKTKRTAAGVHVGYRFDALSVGSAVEYRVDETEQADTSTVERTTWLFKNNLKYQLNPDWRLIAKLNHGESESTQGAFFDGEFTEAVLGYAYRPVNNERLNALLKYTYFYNVPSPEQVTPTGTAADYIQKSHIAAVDAMYDLTTRWSVGGKYAYRLGQLSQDRVNPEFFDSRAHLYVLRADWHFVHRWDLLMEARLLDLPDAQDRRSGVLLALYRNFGDHVKFGAGYNFSDFSDDLTDLDYTRQGVFINLIGKL